MKTRKRLPILLAICLTGCGDKSQAPESTGKTLTAPIQLGNQVQRDLEKVKRAAKQRETDFDKTRDAGR